MSTFDDVAREAIGSVGTEASSPLVAQWAARRYQQLASRARFRHLRKIGELTLPGRINAGTVTTTRGSRTVTGDATAQAAWSQSIVGRYFRARSVWHKIVSYDSAAGTFQLSSQSAEESLTAVSYNIVERYVKLPATVKWLGETFVHYRLRNPLRRLSLVELDMIAPARDLVGSPPASWTEVEESVDSEGKRVRQVEFYPVDQNDELLYYVYWETPPLYTLNDELPLNIDDYVLREGVLIDIFRYEMGRALNTGKAEIAATWRNEARAQSTSWEKNILEAIKSDRGADDVSFILSTIGGGSAHPTAITNARDQIYAQGNRP